MLQSLGGFPEETLCYSVELQMNSIVHPMYESMKKYGFIIFVKLRHS